MHLTPPADAPDPDEDLDTEQDMEPEAPPLRRSSGGVGAAMGRACRLTSARRRKRGEPLPRVAPAAVRLVVGSGRGSSASATASEAGSPSPSIRPTQSRRAVRRGSAWTRAA